LALRAGLTDLVKASLTGSIIGNLLLVFGAAALVGGLRHPVQRFNRTAAGLGTTMLLLSAI
jgi:Ca2+:H+ antiporter